MTIIEAVMDAVYNYGAVLASVAAPSGQNIGGWGNPKSSPDYKATYGPQLGYDKQAVGCPKTDGTPAGAASLLMNHMVNIIGWTYCVVSG